MTDDLVGRLRTRALSLRGLGGIAHDDANMDEEAADRIEELEERLRIELLHSCRLIVAEERGSFEEGRRAGMMEAAKIANRIEELEAALKEIWRCKTLYGAHTRAKTALEGAAKCLESAETVHPQGRDRNDLSR